MATNIIVGDALDRLKILPDESVHCCVTSPPYYGMRNYKCIGQIGLESSPDKYIKSLVGIFREVLRVLRRDGTLWLNLGDSYVAKDLQGIPWRVALALREDGWYLRSEIIWHKPNPMPESVTDRPTSAHEKIFLLAKSPGYYYDAEAIKELAVMTPQRRGQIGGKGNPDRALGDNGNPSCRSLRGDVAVDGDGTRNRRNVWTVATQPFHGSHFATFPPKLIEPCILAGTSEHGVCGTCGAPWVRSQKGTAKVCWSHEWRTTGWQPSCTCDAVTISATVLDPFGGAGTTALVANRLGRDAVLVELNPEYVRMTVRRLNKDGQMLDGIAAE